jgi:hypothetical protein
MFDLVKLWQTEPSGCTNCKVRLSRSPGQLKNIVATRARVLVGIGSRVLVVTLNVDLWGHGEELAQAQLSCSDSHSHALINCDFSKGVKAVVKVCQYHHKLSISP